MGSWSPEMVHSVTVKQITGRDEYGKPTLGSATTVKCRHESGTRVVRDQEGEVVDVQDLLITETPIDSSDTWRGGWVNVVVFPPGATTSNADEGRKPISVLKTDDLSGADTLYEVTL